MRLTGLGVKAVIFYLVLLGTFFAIPYSNLYFLGLAFLSVLGAQSGLAALRNTRGLHATVMPIEPVPAGQAIPFAFAVTGAGRRLRFEIVGNLTVANQRCDTYPSDVVEPGAILRGELPPLPRGLHPLRSARVESSYPFGTLRVGRAVPAPAEVVVYPQPLPLRQELRRDRRALLAELGGAAQAGVGDGVGGVRDWRAGDDPRQVHWKATARRGQLVVREWDEAEADGLEIVLDRRCAPAVLEYALAGVATLATWARERKDNLCLRTQGLAQNYGSAGAPWPDLWRVLAGLQVLPTDGPAPPPASRTALRLPAQGERVAAAEVAP